MLILTGATGHCGYWLIKKLEKRRYAGPLRCLVRGESNTQLLDNSPLDIEVLRGDLEDEKFVHAATRQGTQLIHIASIDYSRTIAEASRANGIDWTIFIHTTGRYSKYKSASAGYIQTEEHVKSVGIDHTILRPTMIYGSHKDRNMWKLIDYLYTHKVFPVFGRGQNLMQPIHARDLGHAIFDTLINEETTRNQDYNIAGQSPITYLELLKTVAEALEKPTTFIHLPLSLSLAGAYLGNLISRRFPISVEQVQRMNEDKAFEYTRANKDFNYTPLPFSQGILEEVEEYLQFKKDGSLRAFS